MKPIICSEIVSDEEDLTWSEDEEDHRVDNLVKLAKDGFKFTNDMFKS